VRRADKRLRITARLIDTSTGIQVCAERYDRDLKDIFSIQDNIADRVVAALSEKLSAGPLRRVASVYTPNTEAYDFYIQGRAKRIPPTPQNLAAALALFEKAIDCDPKFAGGYAGAAYVHIMRYGNPSPQGKTPSAELETALQLAQKAVKLDPSFGPGWGSLSEAFLRKGRFKDAIKARKKAMEMSPNGSLMRASYGQLLGHIGRADQGVTTLYHRDCKTHTCLQISGGNDALCRRATQSTPA
jgi:adenylate cyclase